MKIWLVPFEELDDWRIRAQHREFHMLYRKISRGDKWLGWELPQHLESLNHVHTEVMNEIRIRQIGSSCSGFEPVLPWCDQKKYTDPLERMIYTPAYDRWILVCRWDGVWKGRRTDNLEQFAMMLKKYQEQGGCRHDGRWMKVDKQYEICLLCKRVQMDLVTGEQSSYKPFFRRRQSNVTNQAQALGSTSNALF